jgi:hypothetical protein
VHMRYLTILFLLWCFSVPSLGSADIYTWVDDSGTVHFTDDAAKIPELYWDRVEKKKTPTEEHQKSLDVGKRLNRRAKRERTDRFGRRESWWKERAAKWWAQLEEATSQHERLTKEIQDAKMVLDKARNDGKRRRYRRTIRNLQKEDEKYKAQIEEARHMLNEVLLEEAKLADADPLWLRP